MGLLINFRQILGQQFQACHDHFLVSHDHLHTVFDAAWPMHMKEHH